MTNTYHSVDHDIDISMLAGQQYIECCNDGLSRDVLDRFSIRTCTESDTIYYLIINMIPTEPMCALMLQGKLTTLADTDLSPSLNNDLSRFYLLGTIE